MADIYTPTAAASIALYADCDVALSDHGVDELPISGDHLTRQHHDITGWAVTAAGSIWSRVGAA